MRPGKSVRRVTRVMRGTTSAVRCSTSCSSFMARQPHSSRRQVDSTEQAVTEPPRRDGRTTFARTSTRVLRTVQRRRGHSSGERIFSSRDDACATAAQELLSAARATPPARKHVPVVCRRTRNARKSRPLARSRRCVVRESRPRACGQPCVAQEYCLPGSASCAGRWTLALRRRAGCVATSRAEPCRRAPYDVGRRIRDPGCNVRPDGSPDRLASCGNPDLV